RPVPHSVPGLKPTCPMTSIVVPRQLSVTASLPLKFIAPAAVTSHSGSSAGPAPELHTTSTSLAATDAVRLSVVGVVPPLKVVEIEQPVRLIGIGSVFLISRALLFDEPSTYSLKKMFSTPQVSLQPSPLIRLSSSHSSPGSRMPLPQPTSVWQVALQPSP